VKDLRINFYQSDKPNLHIVANWGYVLLNQSWGNKLSLFTNINLFSTPTVGIIYKTISAGFTKTAQSSFKLTQNGFRSIVGMLVPEHEYIKSGIYQRKSFRSLPNQLLLLPFLQLLNINHFWHELPVFLNPVF